MQTFVILTFWILWSRCQNLRPSEFCNFSGLKIKKIRAFFLPVWKIYGGGGFLTFKAFLTQHRPLLCSIFQTTLSVWPCDFCRAWQSWRRETIKPQLDERTALLEVATLTKVKVRFSADASRVRSGSAAQDNLLLIETDTIKASGLGYQ